MQELNLRTPTGKGLKPPAFDRSANPAKVLVDGVEPSSRSYKGPVLTVILYERMVGVAGFEPATYSL